MLVLPKGPSISPSLYLSVAVAELAGFSVPLALVRLAFEAAHGRVPDDCSFSGQRGHSGGVLVVTVELR